MGSVLVKLEAASRSIGMLRIATSWLDEPAIVEVMLNPDGRLWIDRLAGGLSDTGKRLSAQDGERIERVVAHHGGAEVHPGSPRLSAELPIHGERFPATLGAYALEHRWLYERIKTAALIPHMLEVFRRSHRAWRSRRKSKLIHRNDEN
jgi:Flp pilus assembly CpaF family ATPase